jgi:succinyl-diaminopimelate desuccinylase
MGATLELTRALIELPSVTPDDAGCQQLLADRLKSLGFDVEWFLCGDVSNVLITHGHADGTGGVSLWFLGHTDVVPPGPMEDWTSPPFSAETREGVLYGRGAVDMKGAVAAMVTAAESFVAEQPGHQGQIGILLTSDEEGVAVDGIRHVAGILEQRKLVPTYCLVGEPSSDVKLGDTVRVGRRGSIHARLQVDGIQGHSAFPELLDNPIHRIAGFLETLVNETWDDGDENFPPTHCQVTNIQAGTGARNVTPGHAEAWFNFRNAPTSPASKLRLGVEGLLVNHGIHNYQLDWRVSGRPFRSTAGRLRNSVIHAIGRELDVQPELNTGGGTSDGRFMAPLGTEVVEFGLRNESIHQVNEHVNEDELAALARVYKRIMTDLLTI